MEDPLLNLAVNLLSNLYRDQLLNHRDNQHRNPHSNRYPNLPVNPVGSPVVNQRDNPPLSQQLDRHRLFHHQYQQVCRVGNQRYSLSCVPLANHQNSQQLNQRNSLW